MDKQTTVTLLHMRRGLISIGNHMNSSAIWEIIALSHALEGSVISRGEAE